MNLSKNLLFIENTWYLQFFTSKTIRITVCFLYYSVKNSVQYCNSSTKSMSSGPLRLLGLVSSSWARFLELWSSQYAYRVHWPHRTKQQQKDAIFSRNFIIVLADEEQTELYHPTLVANNTCNKCNADSILLEKTLPDLRQTRAIVLQRAHDFVWSSQRE